MLFLKYSDFLAAFFYKNVAFWVRSSVKILKSEMWKPNLKLIANPTIGIPK